MVLLGKTEVAFLFLAFKDLQSWGQCVIHTGAAASVRTMDLALHSPLPMNLATCKHMFPLTAYLK